MLDLNRTGLEVAVRDVLSLSNEEFALARRIGLGASDMSSVLGVAYKNKPIEELIAQKNNPIYTDEERAVSKIDAVRKGHDLEPLIIQKATALLDMGTILKPVDMYRTTACPYLTINFDGVLDLPGTGYIPVECKFVTTYGDKHYNRKYAVLRESGESPEARSLTAIRTDDFKDYVKAKADWAGIPPYYYVQVQQQIFGLNAPYGYLAALHDKGWELCVYTIPRDEVVLNKLLVAGWQVGQQLTQR